MRVLVVLASGLLALSGIAACIDGVTPDCSNASVCAPIEGDAAATTDDAAAETSTPDTGTPQPTPEASVDAADAADGG